MAAATDRVALEKIIASSTNLAADTFLADGHLFVTAETLRAMGEAVANARGKAADLDSQPK